MAAAERIADQILVLRAQMGEKAALLQLFERYDSRLRYLMRRLLPVIHVADDAVQDVWLTVLRRIRTLRDPGAFRAWIYRIARNRAYRELRGAQKPGPFLEDPLEPGPAPQEEALAAEDAARVHAALSKLHPEHTEVLTLRYIEDMPYAEIAVVVGVPLGTVRSRIHQAKRALRRAMEGLTDGE